MILLSPASKGSFVNIDKDQSFCCFQIISSLKRDLGAVNRIRSCKWKTQDSLQLIVTIQNDLITFIWCIYIQLVNGLWFLKKAWKQRWIKLHTSVFLWTASKKILSHATPRQQSSCWPGKKMKTLKTLKNWKRANVRSSDIHSKVYLKARATANTEKTTQSYRHGNHSCQSCSLLLIKCGKDSELVTRSWKLYEKVLDRLSFYHKKERRDLEEAKRKWRSALHSHEISLLYQGKW